MRAPRRFTDRTKQNGTRGSVALVALLLLLGLQAAGLAQPLIASLPAPGTAPALTPEYENQAKRIAGILRYTQWAAPKKELILGVFGELQARARFEETIQSRGLPLPVRIVSVSNESEALSCDILYLPNANSFERRRLLGAVEGKPILTIGEFKEEDAPSCIIEYIRYTPPAESKKAIALRIALASPEKHTGLHFQAFLLEYIAKQAKR